MTDNSYLHDFHNSNNSRDVLLCINFNNSLPCPTFTQKCSVWSVDKITKILNDVIKY